MRRILVVATRQIGDVLMTTPLIRAARRRWPEATIDVLGFQGALGMLRGNPDVAALIETPRGAGLAASLAFARGLWRRYDLALVAEASDRAHLYGFIAAPRRFGLVPPRWQTAWWKRLLLEHAVIVSGDRGEVHTVIEKLALLAGPAGDTASAGSGPAPLADSPTVAGSALVAPAEVALPDDLAAMLGGRYVVVHAPSMWRYKQWPIEHFRSVVASLLADGLQVILSGGPGEDDRQKVAALATLAEPPRLIDACGRLELGQLARLLRGAALYIGPDTSVTHLAAACGPPTIALFGPTNPMRWGPWPASPTETRPYVRQAPLQRAGRVILLQGEALCAPGVPCGRAGCEDHRASASLCLEAGLAPSRVIEEARKILETAA